ncbi:DUF6082 family protein [Streptomyces rubiginosohelvolus]|uniref:DUF6082 family protein n=1 Tax=Streptomyces rubiginosohelvolus TaxID=67362 RepID=UPI0036619DE9
MRTSTAVLLAGASIAAVGVAGLMQRDRHHKQGNDVVLSAIQIEWLSAVSTNQELAEIWAPDDMNATTYMGLMSANRMACQLSLRDRLGLVSDRQLRFYADSLAKTKAFRDYMRKFGSDRAEEAVGDKRASRLTSVLIDAAAAFTEAGSLNDCLEP